MQSALYALDDLVLHVDSDGPRGRELDRLLKELSWMRLRSFIRKPNLYLSITSNHRSFQLPANCREVLRKGDFVGFENDDEFYLSDGSSLFHLLPVKREGYARLAPSFSFKPKLAQANFWCFGLLKLLRPLGIYSLHAAALASADGTALLLVGAPGSGKSTLAIGLIRKGWTYLSDDAVLLRNESLHVEALACRRSFYIDAVRSQDYSDLSLGKETVDSNGRWRRRVGIDKMFRDQHVRGCVPCVLIFPRIKAQDQSTLFPVDHLYGLQILLSQSAPQLFDRGTMSRHLQILKRLLQQSRVYALNAGIDLYHNPGKLIELLWDTRRDNQWRASSLS